MTFDDDVRADEAPEAVPPPDDDCAYYRPRPSKQVYLIIGIIVFVVGVAVLLVYQTGDRKTILTKEALQQAAATRGLVAPPPDPLGAMAAAATPGVRNCPSGGACLGPAGGAAGAGGAAAAGGAGGVAAAAGPFCPGGMCPGPAATPAAMPAPLWPAAFAPAATPLQPVAFAPALAAAPSAAAPAAAQPASCPRCGSQALPMCDRCSAIMLPAGNGLYYCPHCGTVGAPLCPYCNARMTVSAGGPGGPPSVPPEAVAAAPAVAARPGGQFFCPGCLTTGLPNWSASGAPLCPSCGRAMSLRGATGP